MSTRRRTSNIDALLTNKTWTVAVVFEVLFRWCVPVFVMVSGMLLLQSRTAETSPLSFLSSPRRPDRGAADCLDDLLPLLHRLDWHKHQLRGKHPGDLFGRTLFPPLFPLRYCRPLLRHSLLGAGDQRPLPAPARGADDRCADAQLPLGRRSALAAGDRQQRLQLLCAFCRLLLAGCWLARVRLDRELILAGAGIFTLLAIAASLATYKFGHLDTPLDWHYLYGYVTPSVIVMSI